MRVIKKQQATTRQIAELEQIGEEIRSATEEISFERKRQILERLRTVITLEPSPYHSKKKIADNPYLVIEVLGYAAAGYSRPRRPS